MPTGFARCVAGKAATVTDPHDPEDPTTGDDSDDEQADPGGDSDVEPDPARS
jgi:hypothetical protein